MYKDIKFLLTHAHEAKVALFKSGSNPYENLPTRYDLFPYRGGYAWGYSGTGVQNLAHAIMGKIFEADKERLADITVLSATLVERVLSLLDKESDHELNSLDILRKLDLLLPETA